MDPDLFSNIEQTYQSEKNFVLNMRNFSGINVLSLTIQSQSQNLKNCKYFIIE